MLETSVFVLDNIDVGNRAFNIFVMLVIGHRRRKKINNRKPSLSQIPRDQVWTITEGKSKAEVTPVFRTDRVLTKTVPILSPDAGIYNPELRNVPFLPIC